ncbi:purine nucleoside permease [Whalleya microplaca]|nr:purine nucleoside permease [Whalleya microplaca]
MFLYKFIVATLMTWTQTGAVVTNAPVKDLGLDDSNIPTEHQQGDGKITPKVVIISMFTQEAEVWHNSMSSSPLGDILANNISVRGVSPLYLHIHCNEHGEVCQVVVGESEINAAATMMAFVLSGLFDLTKTYFLSAGIAGINPKLGTLGSVALAKFSVQVALQYEFDAREMPNNFTTGYLAYGAYLPDQYPTIFYGTEVMEVNEALRDAAYDLAARAELSDSPDTAKYRAKYQTGGQIYAAATYAPGVIKCDTATSDVYYSGTLLSEAFENTTKLWTNQSEITYCMTAQEDNAILQVLMRAAIWGIVDFSRVIVMRSGSNFDRPPPTVSAFQHLRLLDQNGFDIAIQNLYAAGVEIVKGIVSEWDVTYGRGIKPTNYIGDIFGTLGGEPNFGPGSLFEGNGLSLDAIADIGLTKRRALSGRNAGGWK